MLDERGLRSQSSPINQTSIQLNFSTIQTNNSPSAKYSSVTIDVSPITSLGKIHTLSSSLVPLPRVLFGKPLTRLKPFILYYSILYPTLRKSVNVSKTLHPYFRPASSPFPPPSTRKTNLLLHYSFKFTVALCGLVEDRPREKLFCKRLS